MTYLGTRNQTSTGKTCLFWTDLPLVFKDTITWIFPDETLVEAQNYCRNPTGLSEGPWCYISKDKKKELCQIPSCGKNPQHKLLEQKHFY